MDWYIADATVDASSFIHKIEVHFVGPLAAEKLENFSYGNFKKLEPISSDRNINVFTIATFNVMYWHWYILSLYCSQDLVGNDLVLLQTIPQSEFDPGSAMKDRYIIRGDATLRWHCTHARIPNL